MDKELVLEDHLKAFRGQLPELLAQGNNGKFAVGRADDRFECFDTYADALQVGYNRYELRGFAVQKVELIARRETIYLAAAA